MHLTFTSFLEEKWFENYHGTKDGYADAFDRWLSELDGEEYIQYADEYAETRIIRETKN